MSLRGLIPGHRLSENPCGRQSNLVNLALQLGGNCGENALCVRLLAFQAACCALGFAARWALAGVYK
ncbi:MAG: hypothetical protein WDW38_007481 [Sanguina aurantia]